MTFAFASRSWRRLTTKPVWWLERKLMFNARRRISKLPPVRSDPSRTTVALLTTPGGFGDAICSAWSWLTNSDGIVSVKLYVDGVLSASERAIWRRMFPGSDIEESIRSMYAGNGLEKLRTFIERHPMGAKLMLPL